MSGNSTKLRFRVNATQAQLRLDRLVADAASVSRRIARTWIATGRVSVGNKPLRIISRQLREGVEVTISPNDQPEDSPTREKQHTSIDVLYMDQYLLVLDKPAHLLSESDRFGSPSIESIAPSLLSLRGEHQARTRVWLVHRLDAGTSGVLVLARTPLAVRALSAAFRSKTVKKTYIALCSGRLEHDQFVDAPIAHAEKTRHAVDPKGKPALTHVKSISAGDQASLVQAEPATGRTHQIRVHLAHLGHPLLGDRLYGGPLYVTRAAKKERPIPRPMLHAVRISLTHPKDGTKMTFNAPIPKDFSSLAKLLGLSWARVQEET